MLIVADDIDRIERDLTAGELACPDCQAELRPWGHARRRWLRTRHGRREIRPRRGCCRGCGRTHVLVAGVMLLRRADAVEVIGEVLLAQAPEEGHRSIAARLARPAATARGWLRRFAARAEQTRAHATRWLIRLDLGVVRIESARGATPVQTALFVLAAAAAAADRRLGPARSPWEVASALCSGPLPRATGRSSWAATGRDVDVGTRQSGAACENHLRRALPTGGCRHWGGQPWISTGPVTVTLCADVDSMGDYFADQPPGARGRRYVDVEVGAAVQTLALSATDRGLAGVIVGGFDGH